MRTYSRLQVDCGSAQTGPLVIFDRLFNFFRQGVQPVSRFVEPAPERRLYAVGDIHGRADLFRRLLEKIKSDIHSDPPGHNGFEIVFLGDYVDRGDQSADVVTSLIALDQSGDFPVRFLKGNHEAMLLRFLRDPEGGASWLSHGGLATLMSYGIRGITETAGVDTCLRAAEELRAALGEHEVFLRERLELIVRSGNLLCVHAACDPQKSPEAQDEQTLLWGHDDFLSKGGPIGIFTVHGHTITREPDQAPNRLGIDTGAYFSGKLTAARFEQGSVTFITS